MLFRVELQMESLNYDQLNKDIILITTKENRIVLTKDLLTEKINKFSQS